MRTLHIQAVDLVRDGVIVTYDDDSRAFYDQSVLMAHLAATEVAPARKPPQPAPTPASRTGRTA